MGVCFALAIKIAFTVCTILTLLITIIDLCMKHYPYRLVVAKAKNQAELVLFTLKLNIFTTTQNWPKMGTTIEFPIKFCMRIQSQEVTSHQL